MTNSVDSPLTIPPQADASLYSHTISACQKAGQWRRALLLFEEMRSRDLAPNQLAYTMAIAACQMYPRTHWHTGLALLKDMLADPKVVGSSGGGGGGGGGGDGTSLSPAAFSYAVNTCSRAGGLGIMTHPPRHHHITSPHELNHRTVPTTSTNQPPLPADPPTTCINQSTNHLYQPTMSSGKYKEALQVLADMDELNVRWQPSPTRELTAHRAPPPPRTHTTSAPSTSWKPSAISTSLPTPLLSPSPPLPILPFPLPLQVRMDSKTYSTAISLYQRAGNLTGAQMVFDRMITDPTVRPDIVAYRLLFNIYYENGAWREALAMLDRMAADKRVRIPPDIFKIAIRTCQKAVDKASPMSNDGVDAVEAAAEITRRLESRASSGGGGGGGGGDGGGGNGKGKGGSGGSGGGNSGDGSNGKKKRSGNDGGGSGSSAARRVESGPARPSSQQSRPANSGDGGGGGGGKRGSKNRRPGRRGGGDGVAGGDGGGEVN